MVKQPLQSLLLQFSLLSRKHKLAGFTLLELLVALLIGGIAISLLLTLVVQLLQTDQKESISNETQQDMQMALNYISEDLREATYIYDGNCIQGLEDNLSTTSENEYCPGLINHIPIPTNSVPVLAFWKLEPLSSECQKTVNQTDALCRPFLISGNSYTLIVYFLRNNEGSDIWRGKARLERYALNQFTLEGNTLKRTDGYISPIDPRTNFRAWPHSRQEDNTWLNLQTELPADSPTALDTLVDFVDAQENDEPDEVCNPKADLKYMDLPTPNPYNASPSTETLKDTSLKGVRSFYACVRGATTKNEQNQQVGLNQDVIIFLKGNIDGKQPESHNSKSLFPLKTQVLIRGVIDKQPSQ